MVRRQDGVIRRHFGATVSPLLPLGGTISVPIPWVVQQIAAITLIEAQLVVWALHLVAIGPPLPVGRLILGSRVVTSGETVTLSIGVDSLPKGSNTVNPIRKGPDALSQTLPWLYGDAVAPEGDYCKLCWNVFKAALGSPLGVR